MGKYPEPCVGGLITNKKGELLLIKSPKWHNKYSMPAGHIELGETFKDALKREIKEEVGISVEILNFLTVQEAIFSDEYYKPKHFVFFDFLCKALSEDVKIDRREAVEFIWVNPRDALKMNIDSFLRKAIEKYLRM